MIYQCQKCGLSKSDSAMGSVLPQCKCDWNAPPLQPAPVQEPVACGYDETTGNCTNNPCCYTTPPEPPAPVQEPVSDTEIAAWAERHDIQGTPTDLRGMFEDAASFTTPPAAQRQWVELTDDEVKHRATFMDKQFHLAFYAGMYQAQQILKEKNT
jgi:hypothetical protein